MHISKEEERYSVSEDVGGRLKIGEIKWILGLGYRFITNPYSISLDNMKKIVKFMETLKQ